MIDRTLRSRIKHKRAPVATSYEVETLRQSMKRTPMSPTSLPAKIVVTRGDNSRAPLWRPILLERNSVHAADENEVSVTPRWVKKEGRGTTFAYGSSDSPSPISSRWRRISEIGKVTVLENTRICHAPGWLRGNSGD